jgi:hypothetical protein
MRTGILPVFLFGLLHRACGEEESEDIHTTDEEALSAGLPTREALIEAFITAVKTTEGFLFMPVPAPDRLDRRPIVLCFTGNRDRHRTLKPPQPDPPSDRLSSTAEPSAPFIKNKEYRCVRY